MPFSFTPFELPGLLLIEGKTFPDQRGYFLEAFRANELSAAGIPPLVQDNLSRSTRGTLRGLHYQKPPAAIGKLVRCIRGKIFDVAVDVRKDSPTYGRWAGVELSDEENKMLWVPEGFAHGFQTMSEVADVVYKQTGYYSPADERGILWNDSDVGIRWPVPEALLAPKDAVLPLLKNAGQDFR